MTTTYRSANPYEKAFGYSRAVRRGPFISVSDTTSLCPTTHTILHEGDAYRQTVTAFREALAAVEALGGRREDVVRVRMYVKHAGDAAEVGRGMREVLEGGCQWAATMICGVGFVDEGMEVEVEVDAVVV